MTDHGDHAAAHPPARSEPEPGETRSPDTEAATAAPEPDITQGPGPDPTPSSAEPTDAAEPPGPTPPLPAALEAILMVVDEPVPEVALAQVLEQPRDQVAAALQALAEAYRREGRGFELRQVADGWRFYSSPACSAYVERFVLDGQQARLTQAALETLAVVAYRQPVSRARISAIRGVNVDGVVRTLVSRGLVEDAGSEPQTGAVLYRTTGYFLDRLGLQSLDELPELAGLLPDVEDLIDAHDSTST